MSRTVALEISIEYRIQARLPPRPRDPLYLCGLPGAWEAVIIDDREDFVAHWAETDGDW